MVARKGCSNDLLSNREKVVRSPALLLSSCVPLGRLLNLSEPLFSIWKTRLIIILSYLPGGGW